MATTTAIGQAALTWVREADTPLVVVAHWKIEVVLSNVTLVPDRLAWVQVEVGVVVDLWRPVRWGGNGSAGDLNGCLHDLDR